MDKALAVDAFATSAMLTPLTWAIVFSDQGNPRGLIEGSPVGYRGEERRVGLHQEPVERTEFHRLADVGRVLEGDHPAEGEGGSQIETPPCFGGSPR